MITPIEAAQLIQRRFPQFGCAWILPLADRREVLENVPQLAGVSADDETWWMKVYYAWMQLPTLPLEVIPSSEDKTFTVRWGDTYAPGCTKDEALGQLAAYLYTGKMHFPMLTSAEWAQRMAPRQPDAGEPTERREKYDCLNLQAPPFVPDAEGDAPGPAWFSGEWVERAYIHQERAGTLRKIIKRCKLCGHSRDDHPCRDAVCSCKSFVEPDADVSYA